MIQKNKFLGLIIGLSLINFLLVICLVYLQLNAQTNLLAKASEDQFLSKNQAQDLAKPWVISQQYLDSDRYIKQAISWWPKNLPKKTETKIFAGVIPHHLLAAPMMAHFFSMLNPQEIDLIVLLTPDHFETGPCFLTTDVQNHLSNSSALIYQQLENNQNVCFDQQVIDHEHAVQETAKFIDHYLPETKIIPILFKADTPMSVIDYLVTDLADSYSSKTLFIASIDFSHYLSLAEAQKHDQQTLDLIKQKNYDQLISLDFHYLDSPESLITLMKLNDKLVKADMQVLAHDNFVAYTDDPTQASTSYFELLWSY